MVVRQPIYRPVSIFTINADQINKDIVPSIIEARRGLSEIREELDRISYTSVFETYEVIPNINSNLVRLLSDAREKNIKGIEHYINVPPLQYGFTAGCLTYPENVKNDDEYKKECAALAYASEYIEKAKDDIALAMANINMALGTNINVGDRRGIKFENTEELLEYDDRVFPFAREFFKNIAPEDIHIFDGLFK